MLSVVRGDKAGRPAELRLPGEGFSHFLFGCVSGFLPSPEGDTDVAEVQAEDPHSRLTLQRGGAFLPQPLYGGLMIYCSDFLLFPSDLERRQFNKRGCFLPRPSIVFSHREMCHDATAYRAAASHFSPRRHIVCPPLPLRSHINSFILKLTRFVTGSFPIVQH